MSLLMREMRSREAVEPSDTAVSSSRPASEYVRVRVCRAILSIYRYIHIIVTNHRISYIDHRAELIQGQKGCSFILRPCLTVVGAFDINDPEEDEGNVQECGNDKSRIKHRSHLLVVVFVVENIVQGILLTVVD